MKTTTYICVIFITLFIQYSSPIFSQSDSMTVRDLYVDSLIIVPPVTSWCVIEEEGMVYATSGCKFFVRLYTHVVENDTTYQMVYNSSTVKAIVDSLQADYNQHGIYFIWDSTLYSLDYMYYDNPTVSVFGIDGHSDGIDLYIFNEHLSPNPAGGGAANYKGINGAYALVAGNYPFAPPYAPIPTSKVVSHEIGHIFGLLHTDNCNVVSPPPAQNPEDSTNCATNGDYVCDTPPDMNYDFDVDSNCTSPISTGDMTNIMANTPPQCMTHFTDGQGGRMRYHLATLANLWNALVKPSSYYISSNTT